MGYKLSDLETEGLPSLLEGLSEASEWEKRRSCISAIWKSYIGKIPARVATEVEVISEMQELDYIRQHITYATGFGDRVTAYLLIPEKLRRPMNMGVIAAPAVIAMHPTRPLGKGDIASPRGRKNRLYGLDLVSRGFVVLAPDIISAGERIYEGEDAFQTAPFYKAHPESTAVGKMIHDHQQGIDLLEQLPFVDAKQIGVIGHSLGAYNAFFLAGWDRRIKAIVSSCGLSPFMDDPEPNRWGQREWFSHIPRLSEDIKRGEVPFEFHEIASLCAPTPFFNWMGQKDHIFPHWQSIAQASLELDQLYGFLGEEEKYVGWMGNSGHDFPKVIREASYDFLEKYLKE